MLARLVSRALQLDSSIGFFQIGGGIAGDFPICVVPMLRQDLHMHDIPRWGYFCQISDSTTSYGSYSGAVPNEKITWGKLSPDTPKYIIESDATIVAPLIFACVLAHERARAPQPSVPRRERRLEPRARLRTLSRGRMGRRLLSRQRAGHAAVRPARRATIAIDIVEASWTNPRARAAAADADPLSGRVAGPRAPAGERLRHRDRRGGVPELVSRRLSDQGQSAARSRRGGARMRARPSASGSSAAPRRS